MFSGYPKPNISYFAKTNFRSANKVFGIYQKDRMFHMAIFGKTGAGKTTLLETLILQDIRYDRGIFVIDIHGDMSHSIINKIPNHKKKDLVYLDLSDANLTWKYNPLSKVNQEKRSLVASHILDTFKKLWSSAWGIKMEHILRYILLTLLDQPSADVSDIVRIIQDKEYRQSCLQHIVNQNIVNFWKEEFPQYKQNDLLPIYNKVGSFLAQPSVTKFLITNSDELRLSTIMNERKICILRIPKGNIGLDISLLVSSLLINSFASASFARTTIAQQKRNPFYIYLDEFPSYMTPTIAVMLSELRKFNVGIILACQHITMIEPKLKEAILGNVGTLICFRLGIQDANYFAKEFYPVFETYHFTDLANHEIYLRLFINGKASQAFSAQTLRYTDIF